MNATRHGGWSTILAPVPGGILREDPEAFSIFITNLITGLAPRDVVELEAAKHIALAYARLDRIEVLESLLLEGAGSIGDRGEALDHLRVSRAQKLESQVRRQPDRRQAMKALPNFSAPVPWVGDYDDLDELAHTVHLVLDRIREPELFAEFDEPHVDFEAMASFLRSRHPRGNDINLTGLWDRTHQPLESSEWQIVFEKLRASLWDSDDEAVGWLLWFWRSELAECGRIAGAAIRAAANRATDELERVGRIRGATGRDLLLHLGMYRQLQARDLATNPTTADGHSRETNPSAF